MGEKAAVDWSNFHRDIFCQGYIQAHQQQIGGIFINDDGEEEPEEVEIDESVIAKAKYNRGRWPVTRWIFGGVQRRTGACFMIEVPDRTRRTLEEAIVEYIRPGTRIDSDGWARYARINEIDGGIYSHHVIIHDDNFVDPVDERINTQTIEGY
ncbi:hypothetical protein TCAL_14077 [Tigriopus californicus]|uniref:ISXO2-like transposase domain-containing protein n=1 Tax=Tigriopus californicus TaxID=6832 RepID=A0A553PT64_TIGCA|nr:hypothetical protein TCAL_14077 [Tigriopus californicus]|eukprot:TCALIF_14077-PA protein Name:"Protein of unknown function" AED:0.23 eAED:0.23 QI:0/0/0/0.5/1/1/2/0/152